MLMKKLCNQTSRMALALSVLAICTGCDQTTSAVTARAAVMLPAPPSFMAPVAVPALKVGEDARAALADSRGTLRDANGRLSQSRGWYLAMRHRYAGAKLK